MLQIGRVEPISMKTPNKLRAFQCILQQVKRGFRGENAA